MGYTCSTSDVSDNAAADEQKEERSLETGTPGSQPDEEIRSADKKGDNNMPETRKPKPKKTKKKTKAGLLPKLNKNYVSLWGKLALETCSEN